MNRLKEWESTDAGQIFVGWLMILLGGASLLWVAFNGLDGLETLGVRSLFGVIVAPFLIVLGFRKLSGAENDHD